MNVSKALLHRVALNTKYLWSPLSTKAMFGATLLGSFALLMRLPFMFARETPAIPPDTVYYFSLADKIASGDLFARSPIPRGFGYPLFVLLSDLLPGGREQDIAILQHVGGVALCVAAFIIAWRLFGPITAWVTGLLLATSPLAITVEDAALPDFVFGALIFAAAAWLALVASRGPSAARRRDLAAVGALLGVAILVKPIGQVVLIVVPVALVVAGCRWRLVLARSAIAFGVVIVLVATWTVFGPSTDGALPLSQQVGLTLFNRVFEVDGRPIPTSNQGKVVSAIAANNPPGQRLHAIVYLDLQKRLGYTPRQAAGIQRRVAQEAIAQYPVGYLLRTVRGTNRFLTEARPVTFDTAPIEPNAGGNYLGATRTGWRLAYIVGSVWWIVTMNGFAGILAVTMGSRSSRRAAAVFLCTWFVLAFTTVAVHGGLPRYSAQLLPITFMVASAGAALGARAMIRGVRSLQGEGSI